MEEIGKEIDREEWFNKININAINDDIRFNIINFLKKQDGL
ncbi:hypothetical protein [Fervidicoccus fontis]|jgi:hypothetical protein|nr:hypothetical protein [Fervidicoccus fontis]